MPMPEGNAPEMLPPPPDGARGVPRSPGPPKSQGHPADPKTRGLALPPENGLGIFSQKERLALGNEKW